MSWCYFISHFSVSSAEHLLPGNGKGSQPNPCVPCTALSQHNCFRFTDDSGGACGLSETALDRYWNQQFCRTWNFCQQVVCYFWLMLFLIWENSPSFSAKQHTLCKHTKTEIQQLEDQIIVNSNYCQENREIGIVLGLSSVLLIQLSKIQNEITE